MKTTLYSNCCGEMPITELIENQGVCSKCFEPAQFEAEEYFDDDCYFSEIENQTDSFGYCFQIANFKNINF